MTRCSVVVPCYNEASRLPIEQFREFFGRSGVRIIFVNDGSTDDTLAVLEKLREHFEGCVEVLNKSVNGGKAEAVREGILLALDKGDSEFVGFWDADLATPLDAIQQFLDDFARHPAIEMVFGARVKLLGRDVERRAMRHYLGRMFATVVSVVLRLPIYDTQCGAKLFRVTPHLRSLFGTPFISRWIFDVELLARYILARKRDMPAVQRSIYEQPLQTWHDVAGSKVRPRDFVRAFVEVGHIYLKYLA